ncbi:MAG: HAMP domain-containing sensor histidine kinase [Eubacteriales bacterium]|jgi:signal transduction histidine kinase
MDKQNERKLYSFLVSRSVIILCAVAALELILSQLSRLVLLPLLKQQLAENTDSIFSSDWGILGILQFLGAVIAGNGNEYIRGTLPQLTAFLLAVTILILHVAPVVLGIYIYIRLVGKKIKAVSAERDEEHRIYDQKRNLLISDMAHDLRTPMTTVSGYAKALADGMVPPEKEKEYLQAIVSKSQRMSEMINELFDYSKLGSMGFRLNCENFDLNELLLRDAADIYTDMEDAGMIFEIEVPDEPVVVYGDRAQISRVFTNLLVNAMRHNPSGTRVVLSAQRQAGIEIVAVADSGEPIPENVPVFDPFVKGDPSRSKDSGSGLGLSIVKMILDMHGWNIALRQPYTEDMKAFVVQIPLYS